ncbi:hypothetical protein V500_05771 [Pseudogymnoascus sp. VKM F-4518 (FW-2643)]|nr:hypothetical protein V500_05771 [Pseudogymnoascus sp. VKM F-4518 (FW-2643)]
MSSNKPLLAPDRPSSEHSFEMSASEEDSLLTGARAREASPQRRPSFWRELGLFIWAFTATAAVIILGVLAQHRRETTPDDVAKKPSGKRNLIFMVSDGMGPASLSMTRSFRQYEGGLDIDDILQLDQHLIGQSRTRSTSSLVTDSAAGATAFSCGLKSYNGAISVLPDHTACGTVLEAAKKAGYLTGLVVTTDLTDATPACFASHVNLRSEGDSIAAQEVGEHPLGRVVDLMLGGGRCHFLPNTTDGSCRKDTRDITKLAQEKYGWNYIDDRAGFDKLKLGKDVKLPLLGLFAGSDIPYEIDRRNQNDVYPSLDEMARTALTALEAATKDSDKGFFLLIEGSRIDHAGHGNDPAAQVHEVLAYDKAFGSVLKFIAESKNEGVVVGTSDHETGGLSIARQNNPTYPEYLWYPEVLSKATHSAEYLGFELFDRAEAAQSTSDDIEKYVRNTLVKDGLGITDAKDDEIQAILDTPLVASPILANMISKRAQIGWSTHGHSGVDVNIYGSKGSEKLIGNHENTDVGKFLREYLDVDVEAITKELNKKSSAFEVANLGGWTGPIPTEEDVLKAANHYDASQKHHRH